VFSLTTHINRLLGVLLRIETLHAVAGVIIIAEGGLVCLVGVKLGLLVKPALVGLIRAVPGYQDTGMSPEVVVDRVDDVRDLVHFLAAGTY
jgi:hypothetical protein